jgi:hypothetical protein
MGPQNNVYKSIKDAISLEICMEDLVGMHAIDFSIFLYQNFRSSIGNLMLFHQ